jgi:replicative DNA helicase
VILLGRVLRDGAPALAEAGDLTADRFADPLHASIYTAIVQWIEGGQPVDWVALAREAESFGVLDSVGGAQYFQPLVTFAGDSLPTTEAADLVRVAWRCRTAPTRHASLTVAIIGPATGTQPAFSA